MIKCTVSFAQFLVQHMQERSGIDPSTLGWKRSLSSASRAARFRRSTAHRRRLRRAMVHDIMGAPGCHSHGNICEEHNGIHYYAEDNALFEICDPETLQPCRSKTALRVKSYSPDWTASADR
ncbi:MAG: hypothetical protein CM1200mP20_12810 [Pseudomonadota bacterium]|nr:MAG: hypothetical protein CM1200mP20_12810 [Pseudomonadota bacterium]